MGCKHVNVQSIIVRKYAEAVMDMQWLNNSRFSGQRVSLASAVVKQSRNYSHCLSIILCTHLQIYWLLVRSCMCEKYNGRTKSDKVSHVEAVSVLKKREGWGRGDHAHLLEFYFRLPWCCYCGVWQNLYSAFLEEKSGRETNLLLWECVAPADTSHTPNPTPSPHLRQAAPPPPRPHEEQRRG